MSEAHIIEQQRVVPPTVEIEKGHRTQQSSLAVEGQNALRIERVVPLKLSRPDANTRDQTIGHFSERQKLAKPARVHINFGASGQRVEFVLGSQRGPFHDQIVHLSSLL